MKAWRRDGAQAEMMIGGSGGFSRPGHGPAEQTVTDLEVDTASLVYTVCE